MINGLWSSALLLIINNNISGDKISLLNDYDLLIYMLLVPLSFFSTLKFQSYILKTTFNFGKEMILKIFNTLRIASYESFDRLGEEKVRTVMGDVSLLESYPSRFLDTFNAAIMTAVGFFYLFWVDWMGATIMMIMLVVLSIFYLVRSRMITADIEASRSLGDLYMKNIEDFLSGYREMKMKSQISDNLYNLFLVNNRENYVRLRTRAFLKDLLNRLLGSYFFYLTIGGILFVIPVIFNMLEGSQNSFLVAILFLMGPVGIVINFMGFFVKFKVAVNRINQLNASMDGISNVHNISHSDIPEDQSLALIEFRDVDYSYTTSDGAVSFHLNNINIKIRLGEVIFISGGNGSGKSTFIKLLCGLYRPCAGGVYFNQIKVKESNEIVYRDKLSCIFSDNYLFSENYQLFDLSPNNKKFHQLVEKMGLRDVIRYDDVNNRIYTNLSSGQRKRLALIYALLEDNEILVFDEWAAEQDPEFRRFFYEEIIPELKSMNRSVVAVTHDDAYFHMADRLVKFDYGKIVKDEKVKDGHTELASK